ncbi:MAG: hypothetical protein ACYC0V_00400 [Armatimonadota bacterium]
MLKRNIRMASTLLAITLIYAAALPSFACYSGLLLIPTADMVGTNQYGIELQVDSTTKALQGDTYFLNTQFGFGNRLEAGFDVDLRKNTDARFIFNGKYVLAKSADGKLALAAGVCNCATQLESNPYLVATKDFGLFRGSFGASYLNNTTEAIIGADKDLTPHLTLMSDYTTGKENFSSVAFNYHVNDRVGIMAGVEFPNSSENDTRLSVHLVLNGPYRSVKGAK